MARRSIRDLLRKKRKGKKALSPEMRDLMGSFEADYGRPHTPDGGRSREHEPDRRR